MIPADQFHDPIETDAPDVPDRFFDRFVFSVHAWDKQLPTLHIGLGAYPARGVVDGFVLAVLPGGVDGSGGVGEQRNLRWSTSAVSYRAGQMPFVVDCLTPHETWRLVLESNPSGIECDLTWHARTAPWTGVVDVANASAETTRFEHLFQSGTYTGWISIDGDRVDVTGWVGARDRSRGVRTMQGGQGLHVWVLAHLPSMTVGALHVSDRSGATVLVEGGILGVDGTVDEIVSVEHALTFEPSRLDLEAGRLRVTTESGRVVELDADASARGGFMAGGGYGGWQGIDWGDGHVEFDVYPLDGSFGPKTLDSALTDRTALFSVVADTGEAGAGAGTGGVAGTTGAERGAGIFEFAHSRSASYSYRPTLADRPKLAEGEAGSPRTDGAEDGGPA